mmetsp:Transcript_12286/g.52770  ORF Transcript_12286/g.52770 Transcript_12286/m.52770 type:complete len:256 (-) Transcript_12286:1414-2181(-)
MLTRSATSQRAVAKRRSLLSSRTTTRSRSLFLFALKKVVRLARAAARLAAVGQTEDEPHAVKLRARHVRGERVGRVVNHPERRRGGSIRVVQGVGASRFSRARFAPELRLSLPERQQTLLDRASHEVRHAPHSARLPDAVHAVRGLRLVPRAQERLEQNHQVRVRQRQARGGGARVQQQNAARGVVAKAPHRARRRVLGTNGNNVPVVVVTRGGRVSVSGSRPSRARRASSVSVHQRVPDALPCERLGDFGQGVS